MRQVPHYLVIGNGRVAKHFTHYLSHLGLQQTHWHRSLPLSQLNDGIQQASHILLLINDSAIDHFAKDYLTSTGKIIIHFSGSHISELAYGAHPLMTFNKTVYSPDRYSAIPFIIDHDAPLFAELLPGLPNPHWRLDKSLKVKYHALCVIAGNFSCLLWQKLFHGFETELHLPKETAHAFLNQLTENLMTDPAAALTGPLTRNDTATMQHHLSILAADPIQPLYQRFIDYYRDRQQKEKQHEHF